MQVNAGCRREDIYTEVSYTMIKTLILEYSQRANWNNYNNESPIVEVVGEIRKSRSQVY